MRKVTVVENASDMLRVKGLWDSLYRAGEQNYTLFQRFDFNLIAARTFSDRERPYVVVAENDHGSAIIPACIRRNTVSFFGEELFDYRNVLVNDAEALSDAWDEIDRLHLPLTVKATRKQVTWAENQPFAGAPFLPHTAKLKRNKSVERNLRLLRERGCALVEIEQRDRAGFIRQMYRLKARQPSGSLFIDQRRIDATIVMAGIEIARAHAIKYREEIIAAALTFIDSNTCRFYGTYYEPKWAAFSPGVCLLHCVIQHAQAECLDFDLMTGEQPYKLRFATEVVPLFTAQRTAGSLREAVTAA